MKTKAYSKKLIDLKLAIKNCIESVEKTHVRENQNNLCNLKDNAKNPCYSRERIDKMYQRT